MKRCVINVSVGHWYPKGHDRLKKSLEDTKFSGDFFGWRNTYPPGSPPHDEIPDAFKAYAFEYVLDRGYESILWLDASCWAIKSLDPLFEEIEKEGHFFQANGWNVGQWCKDSALKTLHLDRETAFTVPDLNGMILGVSTRSDRTRAWLTEFIEICKDGVTLPGPFPSAKPGEISDDPRVLGHAHEQTVASALAWYHKMPLTLPPKFLQRVLPNDPTSPEALILAQGM